MQLPAQLQCIHDSRSEVQLRGRGDVIRGTGIFIALAARLASLPPAATDVPISVSIQRDASGETWTRNFGSHRMRSRLWTEGTLLKERLGAITFSFRLQEVEGRIEWRVCGARSMGMPLPASWFAKIKATEMLENGRYGFEVSASLPLLGPLISYRGWLAEHA